MKVVYRGNHQPGLPESLNGGVPWSTESHFAAAWELVGHEVVRVQEDAAGWPETIAACEGADLFLWTSTWGMAHGWDQAEAHAAIKTLRDRLPTAAFHLDKFWGLPRETQVAEEAWFRCAVVFTADGGNQDRFAAAGVEHVWLPPAVHEPECALGTWRPELASDVGFVGSWRGGYHPEWTHRAELVERLRRRYGAGVRFWPEGNRQVRGRDLADVYASASVLVGDSCMVDGRGRYWSDRVSETLGRDGLLVHPDTDWGGQYEPGRHLLTWPMGDWPKLYAAVDAALADPPAARAVAGAGRAHVLARHTYTVRAREIVAELTRRGML